MDIQDMVVASEKVVIDIRELSSLKGTVLIRTTFFSSILGFEIRYGIHPILG
jgi:hypothetical protein